MTTTAYKFLGTSDERDVCDLCGRRDLKRTVALESLTTGEVVYFGTACAARALKWTVKDVRAAVKNADEVARAELAAERRAAQAAAERSWDAFLLERAGPGERLAQIEKLGGFAAARAAYKKSTTI